MTSLAHEAIIARLEASGEMDRRLDHYLHSACAGTRRFSPAFMQIEIADPAAGVTPETFGTPEEVMPWFLGERQALLSATAFAASSRELDTYCWQLPALISHLLTGSGRWLDDLQCQQIAVAAAERLGDPTALCLAHTQLGMLCTSQGAAALPHPERLSG